MGRKALTTQEWVKKAYSQHGQRYDYSRVVYRGYGRKVEVVCPEHGSFWQRENNHRNGAGCPECGAVSRQKSRAYSYESFVAAAREVHGDSYDYPKTKIYNSRSRAQIVCPEHGPFEQMVYVHLAGHGCSDCSYNKVGKRAQLGLSEFLRRAQEVHGDTYEYLSGLNGMHKTILIKCPLHGEFKQTPSNHLSGAGCPKCVGRVSKAEQEIADFVSSLGVSIKQSSYSVIPPYEVDIYCPDQKVAIEYNGLWWHRDDLVGNKTRKKWQLADEAGVKLVQIFEDEWRDHKEQVKRRLEAMLGVSGRIYARNCLVYRPSKTEAREFLEFHHTQGSGAALNRVYGLKCQNRLVAIATFGLGRFNNDGWELLRYASDGRVVGGISKLVSAFRSDNRGPIVSYADLRWGDGESYRSAGFRLEKITEPDYWWVDPKTTTRTPRYALQPQKIGMSEKEYAAAHNMYRVSGVGHKKWVLDP
jgi:very-short-patch-repair endonuclease